MDEHKDETVWIATKSSTTGTGNEYRIIQPKQVVLHRQQDIGFGFTLRHFIVYPPDEEARASAGGSDVCLRQPMDTVFVKEIRQYGAAHMAGLKTGDRLLSVNGVSVAGTQYSKIVEVIKQTPNIVLQVVPKECDILQQFFADTAHNPETNTRPQKLGIDKPQQIVSPSGSKHDELQTTTGVGARRSNVPILLVADERRTEKSAGRHQSQSRHLDTQPHHSSQRYNESANNNGVGDYNDENLYDSVVMSRFRKNLEQKEQFLKSPPSNSNFPPANTWVNKTDPGTLQPREFYSRPNRMLKSVWPPQQSHSSAAATSSSHDASSHDSSPSSTLSHQQIASQPRYLNIPMAVNEPKYHSGGGGSREQLSPTPLVQGQLVYERTKQFESIAPADAAAKTQLYRSELSRLHAKNSRSNVSLRRQEFETRAEFNYWRTMSANNSHSGSIDSASSDHSDGGVGGNSLGVRRSSVARVRSLSADSANICAQNRIVHTHPDPIDIDDFGVVDEDGRHNENRNAFINENLLHFKRHKPTKIFTKDASACSPASDRSSSGTKTTGTSTLNEDDEKKMRRISYLRATDTENALEFGADFNKIVVESNHSPQSKPGKENDESHPPKGDDHLASMDGELCVKFTVIKGKKSADRSWKTVWAEIRGQMLYLHSPGDEKSQNSELPVIDLTTTNTSEGNFTKRKYTFKLTSRRLQPLTASGGSAGNATTAANSKESPEAGNPIIEMLIQANDLHKMKLWLDAFNRFNTQKELLHKTTFQSAEPQRVAATQRIQTDQAEVFNVEASAGGSSSSSSLARSIRKYSIGGARGPPAHSPVSKSRKPPHPVMTSTGSGTTLANGSGGEYIDKELSSPKSRFWKDIIKLPKFHGQQSSGHQAHVVELPEGASIGVNLIHCPPSAENKYVPQLIALCTDIVESRGLGIVGIYRIPGNTAAISALTEQVNKGFDEQTLRDPRWEDVNVVSSLLKLFIRSLPDGLLPKDMYNYFIQADKETGRKRFNEIRSLLIRLPPHSYETLKHLMRHLYRISCNCEVNLMEPKNLAIVFGPSVVKSSTETLETAVKDMKHQCRIVEILVLHYNYFFENAPMPLNIESVVEDNTTEVRTNTLLDNVQKIELHREHRESASRFENFIAVTSRKIKKSTTYQRKSHISSLTLDTLSLDSSTSTESKELTPAATTSTKSSTNAAKQQFLSNTIPKTMKEQPHFKLNDGNPIHSEQLDDDTHESLPPDCGSMSLAGVTVAFENRLRSLRLPLDSNDLDEPPQSTMASIKEQQPHPLTISENIPFADESPDRVLIQSKNRKRLNNTKQPETTNTTTTDNQGNVSSDETDGSTTSYTKPKPIENIKLDTEVLLEVNRILTNLEKKAIKLNRSLSLNYKSHHRLECCCGGATNVMYNNANGGGVGNVSGNGGHTNGRFGNAHRFYLTKDEKTDKNINKKRQIQDTKSRRYTNRSIKRRHTVGGTQDYFGNLDCMQEHHEHAATSATSTNLKETHDFIARRWENK